MVDEAGSMFGAPSRRAGKHNRAFAVAMECIPLQRVAISCAAHRCRRTKGEDITHLLRCAPVVLAHSAPSRSACT